MKAQIPVRRALKTSILNTGSNSLASRWLSAYKARTRIKVDICLWSLERRALICHFYLETLWGVFGTSTSYYTSYYSTEMRRHSSFPLHAITGENQQSVKNEPVEFEK